MKFHRKTHSRILKNSNFKRAWQLSHNLEISGTISNIAKACEDLKPYIVSNSTNRKKRLPLDTSSTILVGLAKAFSKQSDAIFTDKPIELIPRSSSNAEYLNKTMNISLDVSSIIDKNQQEIIEHDPTSDESVSHENEDKDSIENYSDQEYTNDAKSNNSHISSKQTNNSHHAYGNIRKRENAIVNATSDNETTSDDDSSDDQDERNDDDISSRGESESCSENEYDYEYQNYSNLPYLSTIPEDSEIVTSLHKTEGNQELDLNVTYELNMTKSPIIQTIKAPIEKKEISYEKSPIISWPTSQEFKNNTENNNNNAMIVKPLTLHIPPTFFNAPNKTLASDLLQSPVILTKVPTKLQENPSKRKYIDLDCSDITENENRAKEDTEESNNNENDDIDQAKSPIIPYKRQATDNQNKKIRKLLYTDNSTQTENNYIHLSDEEVNKSDKLDKPIELIPRSSSNAEYHNKAMNMSLDISSIIDKNQQEIIEHDPTSDKSVSHENKDKDSIENYSDQEYTNDAKSNNSHISSKQTNNSHHAYGNIRKRGNSIVNVTSDNKTTSDDDLSDNQDERNDDDSSSRGESESCSENEYDYENQNYSNLPYLSTIPEDSENVTSLHQTEGNQELDVNVTYELNVTKSPIIPTIIAPIEQKEISYEKSPIISWPTSQEFKNNTENNNNNAMTVKPLTLLIPPIFFNAPNETLASDLLQSPVILTKVPTKLQENPSKRKYIDLDCSDITENENKAKEDTEESNNNENVDIDQAKSPIIPYKIQATDNQNNKTRKLLYIENSTQTENNYIHLSDEEVSKSDKLGMPVCTLLVYDNESDVEPRYLIRSKVNPHVMETLNQLANTSV